MASSFIRYLILGIALLAFVGCGDQDSQGKGTPVTIIVMPDHDADIGYDSRDADGETDGKYDGFPDEDGRGYEDVYPGDTDANEEDADVGPGDREDVDSDVSDIDEEDEDPPVTLPPGAWDCAPDLSLDHEDYSHLEDVQSSQALVNGLRQMVTGHRSLGYDGARDEMFDNINVDSEGYIECVYTGRKTRPNGTRTPGGFNTEHTWPQSQISGAAKSDLHHLFPTDETANNRRSNHPFGYVNCENSCWWAEGGSKIDNPQRGPFEVRPEQRGDTARAMFYIALRYGYTITSAQERVLREWHCEDPPDAWERQRNDRVESHQYNRNPFVDRPDFVDRIPRFQL